MYNIFMHFRRVFITTFVWISFVGCLQQGGPGGVPSQGNIVSGGLLNPGGTIGSANPGSSIVDPLGSSIDGGAAAATQDPASIGASPDATQATPPDRPPSTAVPDPVLRPPHVINVGPSRPREEGEEGNGEDDDSEGQTLGEQIAEQQRQEMQQRQEEHEEFQNRIDEALQAQGLGMQEPVAEEGTFPVVSAPAPLSSSGGQILQRESFQYPNVTPNNSNTPQQHPNIPLGANLGNGQQQFPAMRQPVLFSNPPTPLQP